MIIGPHLGHPQEDPVPNITPSHLPGVKGDGWGGTVTTTGTAAIVCSSLKAKEEDKSCTVLPQLAAEMRAWLVAPTEKRTFSMALSCNVSKIPAYWLQSIKDLTHLIPH
jgi:hypothetical protein